MLKGDPTTILFAILAAGIAFITSTLFDWNFLIVFGVSGFIFINAAIAYMYFTKVKK